MPVRTDINIIQPQNWNHWFWQDCVGYWLANPYLRQNKWFDWSGKRNHGTLTNMALPTAWKTEGLKFDEVNDYVDVTLTPATVLYESFTLSFWSKHSSSASFQAIISDKAVNYMYIMFLGGTRVYVSHRNAAGAQQVWNLVGGAFLGSWNYYTLVTNVSGAAVSQTWYRNGVSLKDYAAADGISIGSAGVYIGQYVPATFLFNGILDDFTIWSRAFSASEIRTIYNASHHPGPAERPWLSYDRGNVGFSQAGLLLKNSELGNERCVRGLIHAA